MSGRLQVNGVALNVVEAGAGDRALVFLHYFGGSSRAWSLLADGLAPRQRCVMPDLRGHGSSEGPATGYAVADGADDVAALIDVLSLKSFVVVGHSMGAKIALALASRRPPGLRGLVLVAPSPPTPEPISDHDRAKSLASHGDAEAARDTAANISIHAPDDPVYGQIVEDMVRTSPFAWAAWLEHGSREDISAGMAEIETPALVIRGARDETIAKDVVEREVSGRLDQARTVAIAGAKHLVPLDRPEALTRAISDWLEDLLGPG